MEVPDPSRRRTWLVHHNGDWSGDVILTFQDVDEADLSIEQTLQREIRLPGELFLRGGAEYLRTRLIIRAEQAEWRELLGGEVAHPWS